MTTTATRRGRTKQETLRLISPHANLWLSLETNVDDYNSQGGMRMVRQGRRIKFSYGRAEVPASMREELENHRKFGVDFFFDEDRPDLRHLQFGPQVVSGQMGSRVPVVEEPPLPGWDELGAREIRNALAAGEVADPREALAWETRKDGGKARVQVMEALGKAIRNEEPEEQEPESESKSEPAQEPAQEPETGNPPAEPTE